MQDEQFVALGRRFKEITAEEFIWIDRVLVWVVFVKFHNGGKSWSISQHNSCDENANRILAIESESRDQF